jgi:hypothetical protein
MRGCNSQYGTPFAKRMRRLRLSIAGAQHLTREPYGTIKNCKQGRNPGQCAEARVLQEQGLTGIPHPKGGLPGTRNYTGVAAIDPQAKPAAIFSAADRQVEHKKES